MRALRITGWKSNPELLETAVPEPGPGQVLIKVAAAGACHSDLHLLYEMEAPWALPFTLGHEITGWVESLGPGATGVEVGQQVAVHGAWGCGTCTRCRQGLENYCDKAGTGCGLGIDGGMADYLLVPDARHLVPIPEGLDPVQVAPLTDAGLTPYHAVRRSSAKLGDGSTAVVIGAGGLGHLAVQILKATTPAQIIVVDKRAEALELALSTGADMAVEAGAEAVGPIRSSTGGRGADLVLDFVGSDDTMRLAVSVSRALGDLTLVGIAGGSYPFGFFTVPYELSLQSTYWGSRSELVELLDLAAKGVVKAKVTTYDLDHAADAYRDLAAGKVSGRAVVVP